MDHGQTSRTLLMLVKDQGSDASWQQFASIYHGYLYALIQKQGIDHQDVEELVQDVMVKVWKALDHFLYEPDRCRFRTWLARICKNTALNFLQLKSTRQKSLQVTETENHLLNLSRRSEQEDQEELEWQIFIAKKAWQQAQNQFKPLHLKVYSLMAEGIPASEVAQKLAIKENTAYVYRKAVQDTMGRIINRLNAELDV